MKKVSQYSSTDGFESVKDTLEVLDFAFKTQDAIVASLADGKINLFDLPNALKPLLSANAAFEGIKNVKKELKSLTPAGKKIVLDFVKSGFDIPDSQLEALIEESIDEVVGDVAVAIKWANYRKGARIITKPNDIVL